mmetsp:Transcript_201/g.532  ORF Transcript_201/g.532 Transcript_201/m.532 type:complete len:330 (-) Transcript_201:2-991(-)
MLRSKERRMTQPKATSPLSPLLLIVLSMTEASPFWIHSPDEALPEMLLFSIRKGSHVSSHGPMQITPMLRFRKIRFDKSTNRPLFCAVTPLRTLSEISLPSMCTNDPSSATRTPVWLFLATLFPRSTTHPPVWISAPLRALLVRLQSSQHAQLPSTHIRPHRPQPLSAHLRIISDPPSAAITALPTRDVRKQESTVRCPAHTSRHLGPLRPLRSESPSEWMKRMPCSLAASALDTTTLSPLNATVTCPTCSPSTPPMTLTVTLLVRTSLSTYVPGSTLTTSPSPHASTASDMLSKAPTQPEPRAAASRSAHARPAALSLSPLGTTSACR